MKHALVNGKPEEAQPGMHGKCLSCGADVIARCGGQRVRHWAHAKKVCSYSQKEPKTEWHIRWQNYFPKEWQEQRCEAENGEIHIADIKSPDPDGLVIEFQHSHIKQEERIARENYYKNMVWVVDGTILKKFYKRLQNNEPTFHYIKKSLFRAPLTNILPAEWQECSTPVFFDLKTYDSGTDEDIMDPLKWNLWGIFPKVANGRYLVAKIPHNVFIDSINNLSFKKLLGDITNQMNTLIDE